MPDREKRKVEFIESYWTGGEFGSDYKWNDNHGELIRCKDCKYYMPYTGRFSGNLYHACENLVKNIDDPDWFCADGERRADDA